MTERLVEQVAAIIREHHRTLIRQGRRSSKTFHHGELKAAGEILELLNRSAA